MYSVIVPEVVIRPILPPAPPLFSVNHRAPSGPDTMRKGLAVGVVYSVMSVGSVADVAMTPTLFPLNSTNQILPSGPTVMPAGLPAVGVAICFTTEPVGVMTHIEFGELSVNQRFPSGPATMPRRIEPEPPVGNSVTVPPVVIRAIALLLRSVNQRLLSGPTQMPNGFDAAVMPVVKCVTEPPAGNVAVSIRPMAAGLPDSANHIAPSGPATIPTGRLVSGRTNSVIVPVIVIRPTLELPAEPSPFTVYQRFPSGPAAMSSGWMSASEGVLVDRRLGRERGRRASGGRRQDP